MEIRLDVRIHVRKARTVALSDRVHRKAGRPPGRVLTRPGITQAALRVIERDGYGSFTIAGIARDLEVAPSALYNHVASKQDVLLWVQEDLMTRVDVTAFAEGPWDSAVRQWAASYRDVFADHAPLIPVIATMPVAGAPATLAVYEAVAGALARAGWPLEEIIPVIAAVESFVFGSALDAAAPSDIFDTAELRDQNPVFSRAMTAFAGSTGRYTSEAGFEMGLNALIAGLAQRLDTVR